LDNPICKRAYRQLYPEILKFLSIYSPDFFCFFVSLLYRFLNSLDFHLKSIIIHRHPEVFSNFYSIFLLNPNFIIID